MYIYAFLVQGMTVKHEQGRFGSVGAHKPIRMGVLSAVVALVAPMIGLTTMPQANAVAGSPQVPQDPVVVYVEDFQNASATDLPLPLTSYTGGAAANNATYRADNAWLPGYGACNGWVLNAGTGGGGPTPTAPGTDAGCSQSGGISKTGVTHSAWFYLEQMAYVLGLAQGQSDPASNNAVSSESNGGHQAAGVQFETIGNPITATPGHYYAVSAYFAAAHCHRVDPTKGWVDPSEQFSLLVDGNPVLLTEAAGLNPCVGTSVSPAVEYDSPTSGVNETTPYFVSHLYSGALLLPTAQALGLRLFNATANSLGNDGAFDLPQIVDVTPQLDKAFGTDVNATSATTDAGEAIRLTFTITNTSELGEKAGWSFTDTLAQDLTAVAGSGTTDCANGAVSISADGTAISVNGDLADGQAYCTATVDVITDDDGTYLNNSDNITSFVGLNLPNPTTLTIDPPELQLTKTASPNTGLKVGQTVTYTLTVTDNGDVPVTDITVADTAFNGHGTLSDIGSCTVGDDPTIVANGHIDLQPDESATCTATYVVQQSDIDAYASNSTSVVNSAVASGTAPGGDEITSNTARSRIRFDVTPSLSLTKSANPSSGLAPDDTVAYTFDVTNDGPVNVTNIGITEVAFGGEGALSTISCDASSLVPGASTQCHATYKVTQADVDAGLAVNNTAKATGKDPADNSVTSPDSSAAFTPDQTASLSLSKVADPTSGVKADDTVSYTFTITNTGSVTVDSLGINELSFGGSGQLSAATCDAMSLAAGESTQCHATYVATQTDIDGAVAISNTAKATGTNPQGGTVSSPNSVAQFTPDDTASLSLSKSVSPTTGLAPGDTATYTFDVANNGSVTINNIGINETSFGGTGTLSAITCDATTLAPDASTQCHATYLVTQADVDAGVPVVNVAVATGKDTCNNSVTSPSASAQFAPDVKASLSLDKSADKSTLVVGQTITYSFLVTNTGSLTMSDITIDDSTFDGVGSLSAVSCPVHSLAAGESVTCTATYVVQQGDVDAAPLTNTATASGLAPGASQPTVTDPSSVTITLAQDPDISIVETASQPRGLRANDPLTFTITATNSGDVTLHGVLVADNPDGFTGNGPVPPVASCTVDGVQVTNGEFSLLPGQSVVCLTDQYTVTQTDVDLNTAIANNAIVTGTASNRASTVVTANTTVPATPIAALPALTVLKTADQSAKLTLGELVNYSFLVTNTGNVTISNIAIDDSTFSGAPLLSGITCPLAKLLPQQSTTCTTDAPYVVTQQDIDRGTLTNTATAGGKGPDGSPITSEPSTWIIPQPANAHVSISETPSQANGLKAGDQLSFTITALNDGDVTLANVTLANDPAGFTGSGSMPSIASCTVNGSPVTNGEFTLAPGEQVVCLTTQYTVTSADIQAGKPIANKATVVGTPPPGSGLAVVTANATASATTVQYIAPTGGWVVGRTNLWIALLLIGLVLLSIALTCGERQRIRA